MSLRTTFKLMLWATDPGLLQRVSLQCIIHGAIRGEANPLCDVSLLASDEHAPRLGALSQPVRMAG